MASFSRAKSNGELLYRSSPASSAASAFASSSTSTFSSRSTMFSRASSPTRLSMYGHSSSSPSVRFSMDHRSTSPGRSISVSKKSSSGVPSRQKKTCMCSPTNHPGSFRCSLHKGVPGGEAHHHAMSYQSRSLNFRRSAMTNSLVRIGGVEGGDLVKRALAALIRPSSHQQRRRSSFHPRPSRLSVMSNGDDL